MPNTFEVFHCHNLRRLTLYSILCFSKLVWGQELPKIDLPEQSPPPSVQTDTIQVSQEIGTQTNLLTVLKKSGSFQMQETFLKLKKSLRMYYQPLTQVRKINFI